MNCGTMIIQLKVAEVTHIVSSAEGSTTISWVEEDWFPRHAKSNSVIWAETWNAETLARISTRRKGRCCKLRNEPKRKWDKKVSEGLGEIEIFTGRIKGNERWSLCRSFTEDREPEKLTGTITLLPKAN